MSIPYVVIIGESEMAQGVATVKNMATGEQTTVALDAISTVIS
jgi:histidyl-tRNA synthetase